VTGIELARIGLTTDKGRNAQLLFMEGNAVPVVYRVTVTCAAPTGTELARTGLTADGRRRALQM
jgi:hypothetical protein